MMFQWEQCFTFRQIHTFLWQCINIFQNQWKTGNIVLNWITINYQNDRSITCKFSMKHVVLRHSLSAMLILLENYCYKNILNITIYVTALVLIRHGVIPHCIQGIHLLLPSKTLRLPVIKIGDGHTKNETNKLITFLFKSSLASKGRVLTCS